MPGLWQVLRLSLAATVCAPCHRAVSIQRNGIGDRPVPLSKNRQNLLLAAPPASALPPLYDFIHYRVESTGVCALRQSRARTHCLSARLGEPSTAVIGALLAAKGRPCPSPPEPHWPIPHCTPQPGPFGMRGPRRSRLSTPARCRHSLLCSLQRFVFIGNAIAAAVCFVKPIAPMGSLSNSHFALNEWTILH